MCELGGGKRWTWRSEDKLGTRLQGAGRVIYVEEERIQAPIVLLVVGGPW